MFNPHSAIRNPHSIVSGGQTGVDRAALDVALELGIPCGGRCPVGRWAEDGPIPGRYPLRETPSAEPARRTEWNVRDSDGTLVLTRGPAEGGTAQTIEFAREQRTPLLVIDLAEAPDASAVADWIGEHEIGVLNVAGPRESEQPGIYRDAHYFLRNVLAPQSWHSPSSRGYESPGG